MKILSLLTVLSLVVGLAGATAGATVSITPPLTLSLEGVDVTFNYSTEYDTFAVGTNNIAYDGATETFVSSGASTVLKESGDEIVVSGDSLEWSVSPAFRGKFDVYVDGALVKKDQEDGFTQTVNDGEVATYEFDRYTVVEDQTKEANERIKSMFVSAIVLIMVSLIATIGHALQRGEFDEKILGLLASQAIGCVIMLLIFFSIYGAIE